MNRNPIHRWRNGTSHVPYEIRRLPRDSHVLFPGEKMASLGFVILNEVKNLAHPTDKIHRCAQDDKQGAGNGERGAGTGSGNGERETGSRERGTGEREKILRCAQDDKQSAGKDGFARRIGSMTKFSLVEVSGASNHALRLRNRNRQEQETGKTLPPPPTGRFLLKPKKGRCKNLPFLNLKN